ncbi:claudin-34 [Bufo bufo]|uniref:claudin-34 n=1 Tax=Bufo bufo TaxID=8384 RepID=UPI001ABE6458|nr:claudin-34 [Bufo bufo]XP_040277767.1 claudin-34 [Bufo bufo]
MPYLVHTANLQLAGFAISTLGWILSFISTGLVQWRVWHVTNTTYITSGIAWIGIWRTCFFSHVLVSPNLEIMYCQPFSVTDSFVPREIFVAQGLMLVAIILGAAGKAVCVIGLKNVLQSTSDISVIPQWFTAGGILILLSSISVMIPVAWNMHSVVSNFSIVFPSTFVMPSSPEKQEVGAAISVGIVSAILLFTSGIFFLSYRLPKDFNNRVFPINDEDSIFSDSVSLGSGFMFNSRSVLSLKHYLNATLKCDGIKNDAFIWEIDDKL